MPRPRSGYVEPFKRADGTPYFRARIWLADDSRVRVDVPEKYSTPAGGKTARERADMYAQAAQERENETGELLAAKRAREAEEARQSDGSGGETCTTYRGRLDEHRAVLGRRGAKDDRGTWKKWIQPHIGHLPIAKVTRDDVERVRDALDEAILLHKRTAGREGSSAKRARNIWVVVTTTFKAACAAKKRDLRVREDNPCAGVLPPERGDSRRRTFIYPTEARALFACADVPLEWRELYAIACYLYLRPGELRALTWGDVDLDAGVVHITKAWDERAGEVKSPKTRNGVRDVPIHPHLAPLLERLGRKRKAGELVAPIMRDWYEDARAKRTREHLAKAGITRPRLTENTATTMMVGFRSWRDTGITWLAIAGVDAAKMQRRAGHDEITTTMGYVKAAEDLSGAIGEPFPPLPPALLEGATGIGSPDVQPKVKPKLAGPRLNPGKNASQLAERAGFETSEIVEVTEIRGDSGEERAPRVDVSAQTEVASGPSDLQTPARTVEDALAIALATAASAQRWDVVSQLSRELEARRLACAGNVVALDVKRRRE